MTNSSDGLPNPLPDELVLALRRATDRTINALHSLRLAVRQHVHDRRSRGASQDEIDDELRLMIGTAGAHSDGVHSDGVHSDGVHSDGDHSDGDHSDGNHSDGDHSSDRVEELTRQVLKWSESFYSRRSESN